jgi:hypothetical protein
MSSSSSTSRVLTLKAFDANDFGLWKMQTVGALMAVGLLDVTLNPLAVGPLIEEEKIRAAAIRASTVLTGSDAAGSSLQAADNSVVMEPKWNMELLEKSKRAYGSILLALLPEQLRLCQHVTLGDAHGLWTVLLNTYERKSLSTKVQLFERLFSLVLGRTESIALYVARLTDIERKLKEQDENISQSILLFVLLRGVSHSYATLVTLLKMKEVLTFNEAVEALKNEEERMGLGGVGKRVGNSSGSTVDIVVEDHVAAYVDRGRTNKNMSSGMKCFNCGLSGHIRFNCPRNKGKPKCERCHRIGHVASGCRAISTEHEYAAAALSEVYGKEEESDEEDDWGA